MVTLTNARSAIKMMSQPIGIRILKRYGPTTGRVEKSQSASRRTQKLPVRGEPKTLEGLMHTTWWLEPYGLAVYCDSPVADVENQRQSHITKTMTNLLRLFGFANHVTSNDIKN